MADVGGGDSGAMVVNAVALAGCLVVNVTVRACFFGGLSVGV